MIRLRTPGFGPTAAPPGDDPYADYEREISASERERLTRAIHAAFDAEDQRTVDAYLQMVPALVRGVLLSRLGKTPQEARGGASSATPASTPASDVGRAQDAIAGQETGIGFADLTLDLESPR